MINIANLNIGDKVHYIPFEGAEHENGLVKEIPKAELNHVRVVYHCAGNWDNFKDYTSALTPVSKLYNGWKHDKPQQDESGNKEEMG